MAKASSRTITPKNKTLIINSAPKNGLPVIIPPTNPNGVRIVPAPRRAKTPGIPITTPKIAKYGANLTIISLTFSGSWNGAFFTKYSCSVTSNFPNLDLKSVPFVSDFSIDIFRIYNNRPKIIIKRGVKNTKKDIFPVTGKVGATAIDILPVGSLVEVGIFVNEVVGDKVVSDVGTGVDV